MVRDLVVKGEIYSNGKMKRGTFSVRREEFVDPTSRADVEGTLLRAPINFHTHLGDSFINTEPSGDRSQIVGPDGFKFRALNEASKVVIKKYFRRSIEFMKDQGTESFFDFRESGIKGFNLTPRFSGINGYFLTRPNSSKEIENLLDRSSGFGMSSLTDYEFKWLKKLSDLAHKRKRIFAIHFSEDKREDVSKLIDLNPDYVVHCIEATDDDLDNLRRKDIPISITPRSNIFHGKRPDYSRLFRRGLSVLLGTDNAFITEPSVMEEAEFLYRYQRKINRLSPEQVLSTVIDNPRKVIKKLGLNVGHQNFLLFQNEFLTPYQIVTKPNFYERTVVTKKDNRITFFARKH
jgi:cytosine/adenosine deaminase-related metal-dependent hydrolase